MEPKLAHPAKPPRRVSGVDVVGAFDGKFGGGVSPVASPRLPLHLMASNRPESPARLLQQLQRTQHQTAQAGDGQPIRMPIKPHQQMTFAHRRTWVAS